MRIGGIMGKNCHGCESIKRGHFPFIRVYDTGIQGDMCFIDQEGCGVGGQDHLRIRFCPVCGGSIYINSKSGKVDMRRGK